jgi:hypothetical protein
MSFFRLTSRPFFTTVNSYSSAANQNLRTYRRVDSETSSKGRLTVRAAGGPCTRFTSLHLVSTDFRPTRFFRARPCNPGHTLWEHKPNSRPASKNPHSEARRAANCVLLLDAPATECRPSRVGWEHEFSWVGTVNFASFRHTTEAGRILTPKQIFGRPPAD